jgi:hypothetical protein
MCIVKVRCHYWTATSNFSDRKEIGDVVFFYSKIHRRHYSEACEFIFSFSFLSTKGIRIGICFFDLVFIITISCIT